MLYFHPIKCSYISIRLQSNVEWANWYWRNALDVKYNKCQCNRTWLSANCPSTAVESKLILAIFLPFLIRKIEREHVWFLNLYNRNNDERNSRITNEYLACWMEMCIEISCLSHFISCFLYQIDALISIHYDVVIFICHNKHFSSSSSSLFQSFWYRNWCVMLIYAIS